MQDQISFGTPKSRFPEREQVKCPRCDSTNTKFCFYSNYNLSLPRHFCKDCRRYWTNMPVLSEKNVIHFGKKKLATPNEFLSSSNYLRPIICASSANKESNKPRGGPRDIAWQHGISMENGKKSRCNYCEKVMKSGGATRLKQHLAGGFTNVEQCLHCPPAVRITMVRLLKRSEDYRLEKEREKAGLQPRSERPLNGDQLVEDGEDKDLDVQHLQDAITPFQWADQLPYEVGSSSTQSFQMVQGFDDSSSCALNIKIDYRSSNTMKPKCGGKKGPWTAEEDQLLVSYMQQYGDGNWKTLPQKAGILRSHKSCKSRWTNNLRPDIKTGDFTREEEDIIMKLYGSLGNRWSAIAEQLPGRTETQIKDVWHTDLKKRLILSRSNPRAPHHSVELSNCEAKTGKKLKCTPKTDLIIVESVSAMSSPDIVSSSISDMDDNKGNWDALKELLLSPVSISEMNFSGNNENLFLDVPELSGSFLSMDKNKDL